MKWAKVLLMRRSVGTFPRPGMLTSFPRPYRAFSMGGGSEKGSKDNESKMSLREMIEISKNVIQTYIIVQYPT